MFPGYMFLRPCLADRDLLERHRARPLLEAGSWAVVPESVVRHCLLLEERSASSPLPRGMLRMFRPGDPVDIVSGPLAPGPGAAVPAAVEQVRADSLLLLLAGTSVRVACAADQVVLRAS